jgi:hypothetical protein
MIFGIVASLAFFSLRVAYPFLAVSDIPRGGILVAEGWLPDYALMAVKDEFNRHHYDAVYSTGGPLERGAFLSRYKTYAELGAATLIALGLPANKVYAVPSPRVPRDRTYTSAVVLQRWLEIHNLKPTFLTVVTMGPHARRTRLCFQKAFGDTAVVSVLALASVDYDEQHWWRTSDGVRSVIAEVIAYCYIRVAFLLGEEKSPDNLQTLEPAK